MSYGNCTILYVFVMSIPDFVTKIDESVQCETEIDPVSGDHYHTFHLDDLCWVQAFRLPEEMMPTDEERSEMWAYHPEERGKVKVFGKTLTSPRWFQSYGRPYYFSGIPHQAESTPTLIHRYIDWVQSLSYEHTDTGGYTQCLANWYQNGHDNIGAHADDESYMNPGTPIVCITFGQTRTFRIRRCSSDKPRPIVLDLSIEDGMVYVMGGQMQERVRDGRKSYPRYTHESPPVRGKKGLALDTRISLTFRQFNT